MATEDKLQSIKLILKSEKGVIYTLSLFTGFPMREDWAGSSILSKWAAVS